MLPAIPLALLIHAFPESPRWLAMKGRHDEALNTLARLHSNGNTDDLFVRTGTLYAAFPSVKLMLVYSELEDITNAIEKERLESKNA
jgi:hypothetical protein